MRIYSLIIIGCLVAAASVALAQDKSYLPTVAAASNEPDKAKQLIRRPTDIDVSLFASEPRLANPVAFSIDAKGRFFVVETFRLKAGVTDNRSHLEWLDDDLAARTVADREKMTIKWLGKEAQTYAIEHDRVRLIVDKDGDGRADADSVFADGFKDMVTGLASGVLAHGDNVYFACIPDLWLLKDTKGTGKADYRESLSTGYGVHVAFLGHDLHGLIMGPDGRVYFSIGDRGLHVITKDGKTVSNPDHGAVLRCEPDGSNLEIFAYGLRNPQELAFDNYGNLFTVDNNSDGGDKARVVHLVEGGDSGWRIGYQYVEKPNSRGPWNAEKLWHPQPANTGSYLLPPLMNLADGPSGLTFDPGVTQMPARFKDHFFLADFRGGFGQSGLRAFSVEPQGATFKVTDATQPIWSILATDVDFGTDGALYITDWVDGWDKTGKGRIWRFTDTSKANEVAAKEVQKLLGTGMSGRPFAELGKLLGHADRRVRAAAQVELVTRTIPALVKAEGEAGDKVLDPNQASLNEYFLLRHISAQDPNVFARIHAVWALGQITRKLPHHGSDLLALKDDKDAEIRAQVANLLGECKFAGVVKDALPWLLSMLKDPSPRVRFFASQSLGKIGSKDDSGSLVALLESNNNTDVYVTHAATHALAKLGNVEMLTSLSKHASPAVRLGAVLALRRASVNSLDSFLNDADTHIVLEAARAIYDDRPQAGPALEALAGLSIGKNVDAFALRRVMNANARLGGKFRAEALVAMAVNAETPTASKVEALELLGAWNKASGKDRISGLWQPFAARPRDEAASAIESKLEELLKGSSESTVKAAIEAAGDLKITSVAPSLVKILKDEKTASDVRVAALKAIEQIGDTSLTDSVNIAVESKDAAVRSEGQRLLPKTDPTRAVAMLGKVLESGSVREKQNSVRVLADMGKPEADAILLARLKAHDLAPEVELDLLDAAAVRSSVAEIKAALLERTKPKSGNTDPLNGYSGVLVGGVNFKGRQIFETNTAVYCIRCHKVKGQGGEVGPDLSEIGAKQTREYIATSIIAPNHAIALGFETVVVSLNDGRVISGVFKSEDEKSLKLMSVDNQLIDIKKSDIEERKRGPSAMPEDVAKKLKKVQIRDLVEFLSSQKSK